MGQDSSFPHKWQRRFRRLLRPLCWVFRHKMVDGGAIIPAYICVRCWKMDLDVYRAARDAMVRYYHLHPVHNSFLTTYWHSPNCPCVLIPLREKESNGTLATDGKPDIMGGP